MTIDELFATGKIPTAELLLQTEKEMILEKNEEAINKVIKGIKDEANKGYRNVTVHLYNNVARSIAPVFIAKGYTVIVDRSADRIELEW